MTDLQGSTIVSMIANATKAKELATVAAADMAIMAQALIDAQSEILRLRALLDSTPSQYSGRPE